MLPDLSYEVINKVPFTVFEGVCDSKLYLVHTEQEFEVFYALLMERDLVACDTETTGFDYYKEDRLVGLSFGWFDTHFYLPINHIPSETGGFPCTQLNWEKIRSLIQQFFDQTHITTIWHNYKFDAHFLKTGGVQVHTQLHDTRLLWQFFDENAPGRLKMIASGWKDDLGLPHPGIVSPDAAIKEKEIDKWRADEASRRRAIYRETVSQKVLDLQKEIKYQAYTKRQLNKYVKEAVLHDHPYVAASKADVNYGHVPIPLMCEYAGLDTYLTWRVYEHTIHNVQENPLKELYGNELKLSKALFDAEETGVLVDADYLRSQQETLEKESSELLEYIRTELKAPELQVNSGKQLAKALQAYGVEFTKKTKTGQIALDRKVLDKLKGDYEILQKVVDLRAAFKLKSTYVDGIIEKLVDDRILHCNFNQNVATGRMSSSNPNLQNIPGRNMMIRKAFICPEDYVFVFADYSQIEVRLTAHYSQDPLLLDAYAKGQDVHTRTLAEMFGHQYDDVVKVLADDKHKDYKDLKDLRNIAKRINFGIIYGVGPETLAEQISRPAQYKDYSFDAWVRVCEDFIDAYMQRYLGVKRFINKGKRAVRKHGYLVNHFGRVRHLPHIHARKLLNDNTQRWREMRAERQGVNFIIQGSAADLFKQAVVRVHALLQGNKSKLVNFVHDEVQIYLHKDEFNLLKDIKYQMENFNFTIPIVADIAWSTSSWADKKELG
tara:strand:- start:16057 stop:18213 length:2157 start_codon:yes stop_codon:yes gene_type:complete